MSADRNLLFGIIALQVNFVTRDQLVEGMNKWVLDKTKNLGEIFVALKAMDSEQFKLLDALVDKHVEKYGGDVQKSIQQLSSVDPHATQQLKAIEDSDLQATMGFVIAETVDPFASQSFKPVPKRTSGRFRVIRSHAKGGLGEVFVAQDTELSRQVALKEIQDRFADNIDSRERFLREAEITGRLEHPGIVPVYGLGTYDDGRPFYAMKFIKGDSLKDAIDKFHAGPRGKLSSSLTAGNVCAMFRELIARLVDVCNAVHYAHSRGILHRDLKPGNVMIGEYGETLVVDWGLAKVLGEQVVEGADMSLLNPLGGSGSEPTLLGCAIGTPAFMSPEQASGNVDKLGPATDVYGLGAILYCILTGRPPHRAEDAKELLEKAKSGGVKSTRLSNPAIDPTLDAICLKALSKDASLRYQTPMELSTDLANWLSGEPTRYVPELLRKRVSRWFRRHPSVSVGIVITAICCCITLGLWSRFLDRERKQRDIVLAAFSRVVFEKGKREQATKFMLEAISNPSETWEEQLEDYIDSNNLIRQRTVLVLKPNKQRELQLLLPGAIGESVSHALSDVGGIARCQGQRSMLSSNTGGLADPGLFGD